MASLLSASPARGQTLSNGDFAAGTLAGWTADSINGGEVTVVRQGTTFSSAPGSDRIPFPNGPGSHAAALRIASTSAQSTAILTSAPFVPRSATLYFEECPESAAASLRALVLSPTADRIHPDVSDIRSLRKVAPAPCGTGIEARFRRHEIDVSTEFAAKQAIRLQFRYTAAPAGVGSLVLVAAVADLSPDIVPPGPIADLAVTRATPSGVTLAFTAPTDEGTGSGGSAVAYDIRWSLQPIDDVNFDAASRLDPSPFPSSAGSREAVEVTGLDPVRTYHFAVRSLDSAGNRSAISNAVSATTTSSPPMGRVEGVVQDASGLPAARFPLTLTSETGAATEVLTDESGRYSHLLPPGAYRFSGANLSSAVPASTPPVVATVDQVTAAPTVILGPPAIRGLGIYNGRFATGDLTGWTATGSNGGLVQLEQNGKSYFGDPVPFPDGGDSWAVDVRSWGDPNGTGDTTSVGILVSDPFLPNAPALSFMTHSQNERVAPQVLLLKTTADPIHPKPEEILLLAEVSNETPGMGDGFRFERQILDLSPYYHPSDPTKGTPMRLVVRQHTTEPGFGWYTLFTNFDAGPVVPIDYVKGDANGDRRVDIRDAVLALRAMAGLPGVASQELRFLADVAPVNADGSAGDGRLLVNDAIRILRRSVGLEADPWP